MHNELSTAVPRSVAQKSVKGFDQMLTQEDIAIVLVKPVRWVRERLLVTGVIRSARLGSASYRVTPDTFRAWLNNGCPGFNQKI